MAAAAGWSGAQVAVKLQRSSLRAKAASRQMEHFCSRTGPEGSTALPWTQNPVSSWRFCAGICTDRRYFDILGPVMPDAIVFFWDLQEGPAELFWKESF